MPDNKERQIILDAVSRVSEVARQEKWIFTFEKDEGSLFYSPAEIDRDAELFQVTEEHGIYLNKQMKPCGVVIEYFKDNFLEHHEQIKDLGGLFDDSQGESVVVNPQDNPNDQTVRQFKELFESVLVVEAFSGKHCDCG